MGGLWFSSSSLVWAQGAGHVDSLRVEFFFFFLGKLMERKWSKGIGKTIVDMTGHETHYGKERK